MSTTCLDRLLQQQQQNYNNNNNTKCISNQQFPPTSSSSSLTNNIVVVGTSTTTVTPSIIGSSHNNNASTSTDYQDLPPPPYSSTTDTTNYPSTSTVVTNPYYNPSSSSSTSTMQPSSTTNNNNNASSSTSANFVPFHYVKTITNVYDHKTGTYCHTEITPSKSKVYRPELDERQRVQNHIFNTPASKYKVTDIIGSGTYGVVAICKQQSACTTTTTTITDKSDKSDQFALKKNIRVFPDEQDLQQANNGANSSTGGKYVAFNNSGKLHQLRMLRELKMLHHFRNCPYIVSLKDVYVPPNIGELRDIEMITSLMEADLRDIFDSGQQLSGKHIKWFMYQICLSVYYMQKANILHRDLKPENILVNSQCDVAICDFGLARGYYNSNNNNNTTQPPNHIIDINNYNTTNNTNTNTNSTDTNTTTNNELSDNTKLSSNYVVSRWYRPPELLTNATQVYNKTLDMWSVGCIMYELLSGKGEVLFKGSGSIDQIQRIIKQLGTPSLDDFNGSDAAKDYIYNKFPICKRRSFTKRLPENTCPMAIDLMKRMLTFNMYKRINPTEALMHPYFREFYDPMDLNIAMQPFDTAWEDSMTTSQDLKLEAFETLCSIRRDHQRELYEQSLQQEQQQQHQIEDEFADEEFEDDEDDQEDDSMMQQFHDESLNEGHHYNSSSMNDDDDDIIIDDRIVNSNSNHDLTISSSNSSNTCAISNNCYSNHANSNSNCCNSNSAAAQEDFLMMMVVDTTTQLSNVNSNSKMMMYSTNNSSSNSSASSSLKQPSSSSSTVGSTTTTSCEMNISYQTTRV